MHPDAQHRRRARHLRLGEPGQGQAVRLPRARLRAAVPVPRRAHRRAGARRPPPARPRRARSTRTACRSWRSPAPAWKPARPRPPARSSSRMRHRGLAVHAFKATGVSLRRDILAMEDAGARRSMIFTDLGIVTTTAASGPALTRTMLTEMAQGRPDVDRVRARRRPPRRLRRRGDPRLRRTSAAR